MSPAILISLSIVRQHYDKPNNHQKGMRKESAEQKRKFFVLRELMGIEPLPFVFQSVVLADCADSHTFDEIEDN